MQAKMSLLDGETHALETRQHALSVIGSSSKSLKMRSRISGGREGVIVVLTKARGSARFTSPSIASQFSHESDTSLPSAGTEPAPNVLFFVSKL